eukprot:9959759-Alexandrium_andersonii.AAC.1
MSESQSDDDILGFMKGKPAKKQQHPTAVPAGKASARRSQPAKSSASLGTSRRASSAAKASGASPSTPKAKEQKKARGSAKTPKSGASEKGGSKKPAVDDDCNSGLGKDLYLQRCGAVDNFVGFREFLASVTAAA